jgi:hypothetical protein
MNREITVYGTPIPHRGNPEATYALVSRAVCDADYATTEAGWIRSSFTVAELHLMAESRDLEIVKP